MKLVLGVILSLVMIIGTGSAYALDHPNYEIKHIDDEIRILELKLNNLVDRKNGIVKALDIRIESTQNKINDMCTIIDKCEKPNIETKSQITYSVYGVDNSLIYETINNSQKDFQNSYNLGYNAGFVEGVTMGVEGSKQYYETQNIVNPLEQQLQYQFDFLNKIYGTNHTVYSAMEDYSQSQYQLDEMLNDLHIPDINE